jgi:hypothetical protein
LKSTHHDDAQMAFAAYKQEKQQATATGLVVQLQRDAIVKKSLLAASLLAFLALAACSKSSDESAAPAASGTMADPGTAASEAPAAPAVSPPAADASAPAAAAPNAGASAAETGRAGGHADLPHGASQ